MTMPCRITDEILFDDEGLIIDEHEVDGFDYIDNITISQLLDQDIYVRVTRDEIGKFEMKLYDADSAPMAKESGIGESAMDSMAAFCRSFLSVYERAWGMEL